MISTKTDDLEEHICELFAAGKSHEEIAAELSTPGHPLIPYMIKLYLRRVGERQGFVPRERFEEHLRASKTAS
jgi:hypothetical protein